MKSSVTKTFRKRLNDLPASVQEQAAESFFDPFLVVVDASRNEEARHAVIGLDARWNLLYVVHIESEENVIRIISARKATRHERIQYED